MGYSKIELVSSLRGPNARSNLGRILARFSELHEQAPEPEPEPNQGGGHADCGRWTSASAEANSPAKQWPGLCTSLSS